MNAFFQLFPGTILLKVEALSVSQYVILEDGEEEEEYFMRPYLPPRQTPGIQKAVVNLLKIVLQTYFMELGSSVVVARCCDYIFLQSQLWRGESQSDNPV
jgi:hypothetical protein